MYGLSLSIPRIPYRILHGFWYQRDINNKNKQESQILYQKKKQESQIAREVTYPAHWSNKQKTAQPLLLIYLGLEAK
jgi:hypothetical protein